MRVKVLVVDDSVVMRRMLTDIIREDATLEFVGAAPNGKIAYDRLPHLAPDVIVLDIEMPEMGGLEFIKLVKEAYPKTALIVFSGLTESGAGVTLEALARGATDYVTKPSRMSADAAIARIREELLPKLRAFSTDKDSGFNAEFLAHKLPKLGAPGRIDIVAIGTSTGGPNALPIVLGALPSAFPIPVVVVQHMPPVFTKYLADSLQKHCKLEVVEAQPGMEVCAGRIFLAPGGYHMVVEQTLGVHKIATNLEPPENSCRPAVDVLFRSVAKCFGDKALGVVMTGLGQDGMRGSEYFNRCGSRVVVQDKASSVIWGMPGSVAEAGYAETILALDRIGEFIVKRTLLGRAGKWSVSG